MVGRTVRSESFYCIKVVYEYIATSIRIYN